MLGLSPVAASEGYSPLCCMGFSSQWLLITEHRLQVLILSSCGMQAVGYASFSSCICRLSCSTVSRIFLDQRSNPCPKQWQRILYHWIIKEVPRLIVFYFTCLLNFPDYSCFSSVPTLNTWPSVHSYLFLKLQSLVKCICFKFCLLECTSY